VRHRAVALFLIGVAVFLLAPISPAVGKSGRSTQVGSFEHVRRYETAVTIETDGSVLVDETLAWDFGSVARHGIKRDIPVLFSYDDQKKGYDRSTPLDVLSVQASAGASAKYEVQTSGNSKIIKIGDANQTTTGEHTYTIKYRLRGALNHFTDHDELFLNVIGNGVTVPIDQARDAPRCPRRWAQQQPSPSPTLLPVRA